MAANCSPKTWRYKWALKKWENNALLLEILPKGIRQIFRGDVFCECRFSNFSQIGPAKTKRQEFPARKPLPLLVFLEAAGGIEPPNNGFADRRLSHLATPPG